jgi:hypothetical protein
MKNMSERNHFDSNQGRWPNADDIRQLRAVVRRYSARDVLLAEWVKRSHQKFYRLRKTAVDPKMA